MVANGNELAEFYNFLTDRYAEQTVKNGAAAADAINTYTVNNSTNNGPKPEWLVLNEISIDGIELMNTGLAGLDLTGCALRRVTPDGSTDTPLPAQTLPPAGFLTLPLNSNPGDRIVLLAGDGVSVLDSFDVKFTPRGRNPDGSGAWWRPSDRSRRTARAADSP